MQEDVLNATEYYARHRDLQHKPSAPVARFAHPGVFERASEPQIAASLLKRYAALDRCLDVGCANLDFLALLRQLGARDCCGVDIVPYPAWEGTSGIQTKTVNLDESPLPYEDGHFSAVTMLMVLEHVFDVFGAVSKAARVLRPGGHLLVAVPNISYVRITVPLLFGAFPVTSSPDTWREPAWDGFHLHNFTRHRLEWLLRTFGNLSPLGCWGSGRWWRLRSLAPGLLCGDLIVLAQKRQS